MLTVRASENTLQDYLLVTQGNDGLRNASNNEVKLDCAEGHSFPVVNYHTVGKPEYSLMIRKERKIADTNMREVKHCNISL